MKQFLSKRFPVILLIVALTLPMAVFAGDASTSGPSSDPHGSTPDTYKGLVRCTGAPLTDAKGNVTNGEVPCDFNALIGTFSYLINWGFGISIPIAVALFVWAGLLYVTGIPKNIDKAKGIFRNTSIGFIIMLVAFTVVHTLVGWLGNPNSTPTGTNSNPLPISTDESLLQVQPGK